MPHVRDFWKRFSRFANLGSSPASRKSNTGSAASHMCGLFTVDEVVQRRTLRGGVMQENEMKKKGYCALAEKRDESVHVISRNDAITARGQGVCIGCTDRIIMHIGEQIVWKIGSVTTRSGKRVFVRVCVSC